MRAPQLMLCKPATNDRWDRRTVELAAFAFKNGHCNVPEVRFSCSSDRVYKESFVALPCLVSVLEAWQIVPNPSQESLLVGEVYKLLVFCKSPLTMCVQDASTPFSLGSWVRKQRSLWQQASLSQDRVQILSALGFELGSETRITEEWEFRFDQLQEVLLHMVRPQHKCSLLLIIASEM